MHAKNTKYTFIRYKNINKIYTRHKFYQKFIYEIYAYEKELHIKYFKQL